ncbi:MAG: MotA/TolQ/ExbB proton channel family protein [Methylothermaceae bacterium]|nr:MotA/TolQ/ExbB proton channel family protein [Methylothermaceae bacterium]
MGIVISAGRGGKKQVKQVLHEVAQGDRDQLLTTLQRAPGAYAKVLEASIAHLQMPEDEWEIAVSDALLQQSVRLDRFSGLILVIAAVAPLLGLLGTVTGMISTFDVITQFGTGDPKLLATGISIALITTQVGLIVAIPTLLLGNVLNGWSSSLKNDLELTALGAREAAQDHTSPAELEETLAEDEAEVAPRTAFAGT